MDWWWSVALGVASSMAASVIFLSGLTLVRPHMKISDYISNENGVFRIKVVNWSRWDAVDVRVHVMIEQQRELPEGKTHNILTRVTPRFEYDIISGRNRASRADRRAKYARWVRLGPAFEATWQQKGEHFPVVVTVFARHALSGVGRQFEKRYGAQHLSVRKGVFRGGDSLDINLV